MLIKYDKLEDYCKKLETLSKETETYISIGKDITETGLVTPSILIQALDKEKCFMYFYSELPSFQVIPDVTLMALPNADEAKKSYSKSHDEFEQKIDVEYKKLISLLKDKMGFSNVVEHATIMQ